MDIAAAPTPTTAADPPSRPPQLDVVDMTKRFGRLVALDQVSMTLKPGTIHALLGENGAGKSTLVKCVMGFYQPTAGQVLIDQMAQPIHSPQAAHAHGIGMVYQHFTSVPAMTVAENLVLSRYEGQALIRWQQEYEELRAFMARSPFQIDLETPVSQLAAGQKQKLEILKQIYLKSRILILDEPTSVLTPGEADEVLGLLKAETEQGKLSILLITHKFREVQAFADEVTVLRKGQLAGQGQVQDLTNQDLAEMMLGQSRPPQTVDKLIDLAAHPVLSVKDLHVQRNDGLDAIQGIDLQVHSGEIVGIAGVSGNGQRELIEVLAGQRTASRGTVSVQGEPYYATRAEMARHQVFALPEEPLRNACLPNMSVAENMALRSFDQPPQARWGWLLSFRAIRSMARKLVETFSVKTPSVETPISHLSGGNVQRAVLARELSSDSIRLLIAANPCFGLDFAAVEFIHRSLVEARNRGVAVLLVSEDLDELLTLADRILVISEGRLVYESAIADADRSTIGQRMAGQLEPS
ncbi:ABC transporter ATP-binding protein [Romeria aff. gracilis LEGE 07310]|uniref:ABC transporter ATP-binding protein n=1 Tax=Vasconcelosia minhoensis LEGE 07310 TaxID=915328 RepID=A0A8J7AJK0_9CYAN|nr:ABC transporter ATP-binding protein [Romeria gracilis]MBE9075804.1 ABC transporter ATP-binding protein [Romeria aff. gracilis LEGE 07310]